MDRPADVVLDERGRACPAPVLALGRCAAQHPAGTLVQLRADDPAAATDVPVWCRLRGAALLAAREQDGVLTFLIRLG